MMNVNKNSFSNLLKSDKRTATARLKTHIDTNPEQFYDFLEVLLSHTKSISDPDSIEWCRWLMAGGLTPDAFAKEVKKYDNATTCGLVWTANFVAYRCRTCGVSPCMSLCAECFQRGNHENHDFNMFRSQAGGACDCGDIFVMKESGFCGRHGPQAQELKPSAPVDLLLLAHAMMPRLISRLMHHLRSFETNPTRLIEEADNYLTMLQDFSALGAAVRTVMTQAITDTEVYKELTVWYDPLLTNYQNAVDALDNPSPPDEFKDCPSLQETLVHKTFLEELMFWTVKLEFPQKIVCLLLNMLPDADYKEALTRSFVLHYSRIPMMLEKSSSPDTLSNRVVHVSVQLFSNEGLALRMTEQLSLLHVMVVSLKYMMSKILIPNTLHDASKNFHFVVDCGRQVMKEHCYWPLVSDLNNVLSHKPVALRFMSDTNLLEMWFAFLSMFQGMNVNQREMSQHVEFEPSTYYAAFSAELEASAYPMWALVSHLKDSSTVNLTRGVLNACISALQEWFEAIDFHEPTTKDFRQVSFHLPLHRYLAILMSQAVKAQGLALKDVLPPPHVLELVYQHPLRLQVAFYEILNGMWVRNGLQIKGQMMTYIQCNFCNSMVDADLYLLQVCATQSDPEKFLLNVLKMFRVIEALSIAVLRTSPPFSMQDQEFEASMLESCLTFLSTLVDIRSNLGANDTLLSKLEMVTLLCMGDKTHSQLMELMPERCGTTGSRDFDTMLAEVADYRAPSNMQQGMYAPKPHVWEDLYDPMHVLLRAVHRKDFQTSMDRFTEYVQQTRKLKPGAENIWPPLRPPSLCGPAYDDPRNILQTRVFHAVIFCILHQAAERRNMSEHVLALAIYLLEMAVLSSPPVPPAQLYQEESSLRYDVRDLDLSSFYESDWLALNVRTVIVSQINCVLRAPESEDEDVDIDDSFYSDDMTAMDLMRFPGEPMEQPEVDLTATAMDVIRFEPFRALQLHPEVIDMSHDPPRLLAVPGPSHYQPDSQLAIAQQPQQSQVSAPNEQTVAVVGRHPPYPTFNLGAPGTVAGQLSTHPLRLMPEVLAITGTRPRSRSASPASSSSTRQVVPASRNRRISTLRALARNQTHSTVSMPSHSHYAALFRSLDAPIRGFPYMPPLAPPPKPNKKKEAEAEPEMTEMSFNIGESIISLLLKLHAALSGTPDGYVLGKQTADGLLDSRIGDGAFFVSKVLDRIAALDDSCRQCIEETRGRLWPKRAEEGSGSEAMAREAQEREDRRRRAKDRQQKLMQEFANRQKQFMEKTKETEEAEDMEWSEESEKKKCEYDCVICNQSSPSSEDKPMGLVVLLQATSVLSHMRRSDCDTPLPTSDAQLSYPSQPNLVTTIDERLQNMEKEFSADSWQLAVNIGWEAGVHVQTCGHHLHMDCLSAYLLSLKGQQRPHSPAVEKGEYLCPLCRQLANSVLPLAAELGELTAVVRARPPPFDTQVASIGQLLSIATIPPEHSPLSDAMSKSMQDMTAVTNATPMRLKHRGNATTHQSLFLFVTSIARTNLEVEMVQKGGAFLASAVESPLIPKRSCIVPLLHVLAKHGRALARWPTELRWRELTEPSSSCDTQVAGFSRDVPLLLTDPTALLLHLLLLLPLNIDQSSFSCLVKCIFNLLYFQVLTQISFQMTEKERESWRDPKASDCEELSTLDVAMGFVVSQLSGSRLVGTTSREELASARFSSATSASNETSTMDTDINNDASQVSADDLSSRSVVEAMVQALCLPFLRIATLLRHHMFAEEIPQVRTQQTEFVRLVYYLELVTEGMDWNKFNAAVALNFLGQGLQLPKTWLSQLIISSNWCNVSNLIVNQHVVWHPPRLLTLPQLYDKIFQLYHARQCQQCSSVPREASLCLLCGTLVCLKENCCKNGHMCEAVQHALDCGAGTGMFLVVTSSYVIVIRGKRACLWGSVYLDSFGEEDRELKRGKPLYLCSERYRMLQEQWIAHRFDHTNKKWVWHRDAL